MRQIKFRVWDKILRKWLNPDAIWLTASGKLVIRPTEKLSGFEPFVSIQQFTGLLDKQGKEIYEGDIVRQDNPYTSLSSGLKVLFEQKLLQFGVELDIYFIPLSNTKGYWEVIGNVNENLELLEEDNG